MNKGLLFKLIGIMVITIIAMACASAPENTATQTKTESGVIDYNKIINGDLSDFAGFWVNGRNERIQLRADGVLVRTNGTFVDGENAVDFRRTESEYLASGGEIYMWLLNPDEMGYNVALYPPGVDIKSWNGIIPTDNTKIRLTGGGDLYSYINSAIDVFYRE